MIILLFDENQSLDRSFDFIQKLYHHIYKESFNLVYGEWSKINLSIVCFLGTDAVVHVGQSGRHGALRCVIVAYTGREGREKRPEALVFPSCVTVPPSFQQRATVTRNPPRTRVRMDVSCVCARHLPVYRTLRPIFRSLSSGSPFRTNLGEDSLSDRFQVMKIT